MSRSLKVAALAALATLATPATAQPIKLNIPAAPVEAASPPAAPDPFAQALAARSVAEYARRHKDPQAMLTAARMLAEIPFSGEASADAAFTPAGLFAEARTFARSDEQMLLQIRIAESSGSRGVTSSQFGRGLVRNIRLLNPRGAYQFSVNAKGGEPLRIGAIGDVGTALTMRLRDASGRTVCMDDQGDYAPVCQLRPSADGQYRVDILNKSAAKSRAVILSN